jgi:transcriptional repressor OPI1
MSPSEAGSAMSLDEKSARPTSVSMDDPDVRIAAEALSGLGNPGIYESDTCTRLIAHITADFARSPVNRTYSQASPSSLAAPNDPEPLFQLFTKAHPWVGGTINGSLSAYSATKNFSPRFVQAGANIVEQRIGNPVANTVSMVGRVTGVESGLRWYYGGTSSRPNEPDLHDEESANKRRRVMNEEVDLESGALNDSSRTRRESQDSTIEFLPAYRASKPPSYREEVSPTGVDRRVSIDRPLHNRSWSSQVFVSTSGLGVALSVTSRRTLGLCLSFLGQQAQHVTIIMNALKMVLEQYDEARDEWHRNHDASLEAGERERTPENDEASRRLAHVIKKHSDDIWRTLEHVVTSVSNYAGGALPENARHFVRNQLMSLPQRWRIVSDNQTGEGETSRAAHRMIAFATEGLDMISQVSQTMKLTLDSAEGWLQRVGRRQEMVEMPYSADNKDYMVTSPVQQHHDFDEKR